MKANTSYHECCLKIWTLLFFCLACGTEVGNGRRDGGPVVPTSQPTPQEETIPTSGGDTNSSKSTGQKDSPTAADSPTKPANNTIAKINFNFPESLFHDCGNLIIALITSAESQNKNRIELTSAIAADLTLVKSSPNHWTLSTTANASIVNLTITSTNSGTTLITATDGAGKDLVPSYQCTRKNLTTSDPLLTPSSGLLWTSYAYQIVSNTVDDSFKSLLFVWYLDDNSVIKNIKLVALSEANVSAEFEATYSTD